MYTHLLDFIEQNKIIYKHQYGFRQILGKRILEKHINIIGIIVTTHSHIHHTTKQSDIFFYDY